MILNWEICIKVKECACIEEHSYGTHTYTQKKNKKNAQFKNITKKFPAIIKLYNI